MTDNLTPSAAARPTAEAAGRSEELVKKLENLASPFRMIVKLARDDAHDFTSEMVAFKHIRDASELLTQAADTIRRLEGERARVVVEGVPPSAYLKRWWQEGRPRCRVDLTEVCEPWLDALKPEIVPLYEGAAINTHYEAELAKLKASLGSEGWRTIDSAPLDRPILVFAPGRSDRWEGDLGDLICRCEWHPDAGFCVCELRDPTHWMPLPQPPGVDPTSRTAAPEGGA